MLPRLLRGNKLNNVFVARSNGISRKANWSGLEGSCRNMGAVWQRAAAFLAGAFACLQGDGRAGARAGAALGTGPCPRVSCRPVPHLSASTRGGNGVLWAFLPCQHQAWSVASSAGAAFGNGPGGAELGRTEGEAGTEGLQDWACGAEGAEGSHWTHTLQEPAPVSSAELLQTFCVLTGKTCSKQIPYRCLEFLCEIRSF